MTMAGGTAKTAEARHAIQASADEVFLAWVTPEIIEDWWGPDGFTTVVRELDLREGGRFVFRMTGPNGDSCDMTGRYHVVERPSRLVFEIIDHCLVGLPEGVTPQLEPALVTVEIIARGARTEVVVTHAELEPSFEPLAAGGWTMTLAKLAERIESRRAKSGQG